MALSDALARVPGLGGYLAQNEVSQNAGNAQLQKVITLAQLQKQMQAGEQERQMRAELAAATTDEQREAIAMKYGGPTAIMSNLSRKAQTAATRESAIARLAQAAKQHDLDYQLRRQALSQKGADADADRALRQWYDQGRMEIARQAAAAGIAKTNFDTGAGLSAPGPIAPPPSGPPAMGPSNPAQASPMGGLPTEAQGMGAFLAPNRVAGSPFRMEVAPGAVSGLPSEPQPPVAPPVAQPPVQAPVAHPVPAAPDNLDARDRMLAQMGPAGAPAAPAAPAGGPAMPPKKLTLADAPGGLSPKAAQQWLLAQSKPSIAGGGTFAPETLEFMAKQYLTGDRQVVSGFARNATARIQLQNAIVDEAKRQGMSPEQTAAKIADFAGTMAGSRTVGQRAANISLAATEAQEMIGIVKETSDAFGRTSFVPWNIALRAYESGTGSPEIAAFGASINALVNVYARAINPTGQPTVSDKEHARDVINTVQSPAQVNAVLGIINRELEIAKKAPKTVREATATSITGGTPPAAPGAPAPSAAMPTFASEAEAQAAAAAGRIKAGDKIKIGNQTGTWR